MGKLEIADWTVEELEKVLKAYEAEYKSQNNRLVNLDQKAQYTATIAGVFIAATLAFLNAKDFGILLQWITPYAVCFFETSIGLLMLSVMFCIKAMAVREYLAPLSPKSFNTLVGDMAKIKESNQNSDITASIFVKYLESLILAWEKPVQDVNNLNDGKAYDVYIGQLLLCTALALISIFIVMVINISVI